MSERSSLRELIELMELKEFKELLKKEEKKPIDKKWWNMNPIKLYIILVLLYPFIGKGYISLLHYIGIN